MYKRDVSVFIIIIIMPTVSRLVRIQKIARVKVISKSRFYNTFDYFGNKRKVRDWTVIRKLLIV